MGHPVSFMLREMLRTDAEEYPVHVQDVHAQSGYCCIRYWLGLGSVHMEQSSVTGRRGKGHKQAESTFISFDSDSSIQQPRILDFALSFSSGVVANSLWRKCPSAPGAH